MRFAPPALMCVRSLCVFACLLSDACGRAVHVHVHVHVHVGYRIPQKSLELHKSPDVAAAAKAEEAAEAARPAAEAEAKAVEEAPPFNPTSKPLVTWRSLSHDENRTPGLCTLVFTNVLTLCAAF